MKDKIYSIAAPSLSLDEKSFTVSLIPDSSLEKTYCISLSVSNPFGKNEHDYPVSMPSNSRYKAIKEDNAGVFATKTYRIKGVLSDVFSRAIREIEVEANILSAEGALFERVIGAHVSSAQTFQHSRDFSMEISRTQEFNQLRCFNTDIYIDQGFVQHNRTFGMNHIAEENTARRITDEYEMAAPITEEMLLKKVRQFAADVVELPEWIKIARILYGERFYEHVMAERTKRELNEINLTDDTGDLVVKEWNAVPTDDIETADRKIREINSSYEEYDLFDGQGIPVYLPDYDLFARIQRELPTIYTRLDTADRDILKVTGEFDSYEIVDRSTLEVTSIYVNSDKHVRKKSYIETADTDFDYFSRTMNIFAAIPGSNHEYAVRTHSYHAAEITDDNHANKTTNEYAVNSIVDAELMNNRNREHDVNMSDILCGIGIGREFIIENMETDIGNREYNEYITIINNEISADKTIDEITTSCIKIEHVNRLAKNIVTDIIENELSDRRNKEITVLEERLQLFIRNRMQINATREEYDLFEGQGLPVYLPDYDLFARIQRELDTEMILSKKMTRSEINILSKLIDTMDSKRFISDITTNISEIINTERTVLEIQTENITYDVLAETPAKKTLIHEQDIFDVSRQFRADYIESHTFDRDNTLKTIVNESERFDRPFLIESSIEETDIFKIDMTFHANCIKFDDFIVNNIYNADVIEVTENKVTAQEQPKFWLRHSRQSWWTNANWKKTR
ncbi:hypothetical protein [Bacillus cereus group sp. BfR-BA-01360]|uniref:hypothetical protein n=1 Tax=Bacillus cereus group sp. BfR-BA-01360 TaxID=2920321 RepID=UPI001F599945|nr:hypothetical protein [Bacillus cereus group sp. BfR-BA-01360]